MVIAAVAQEKADIEISYTASCVNLWDGSNLTPNQYILLANAKELKSYDFSSFLFIHTWLSR